MRDEAEEGGHEATTEDTFNVVLIVLQGRQRKIAPMMRKVTPSGRWGMRRRREVRLPLRIPLMLCLLCNRGDRGRSLLWGGKSLHLGDEGWDWGGGHEATTEDTFNVVLIVLQGRQRRITPMMRKVTPSGWWGMRQRRGDMRLPLRIPLMLCLLCYRGDRGRSLLWWGKSLHLGDEGWDWGGGHEATTEDSFNIVLIVLQWRQRKTTPMMRKVTPSGSWGMRRRRRGDMRLPLRIPLMSCLLCYRGDRGRSLLWWGKSLHLGDEGWDWGGGHEATTEDTFNVVSLHLAMLLTSTLAINC